MEKIGDNEVVEQFVGGEPSEPTDRTNDRGEGNASVEITGSGTLHGGQHIVKFMALNNGATIPQKGTPDSAGYDLYSAMDVVIEPKQTFAVPLGFATEIPPQIHGRIESRSGMALKGAVVLTGVIDADYRGEWKVILHNLTNEKMELARGTRLAQVVFRPTVAAAFQPVSELVESSRGAGGFGSTGQQ